MGSTTQLAAQLLKGGGFYTRPEAESTPVSRVSRASHLSAFVANELSGRHSYLKEVIYETNGVATGDTEDAEVSRF
jgi:hypothetical protein